MYNYLIIGKGKVCGIIQTNKNFQEMKIEFEGYKEIKEFQVFSDLLEFVADNKFINVGFDMFYK